ncbi:MAG TPA: DUF5348 domain-containing protein [Ktedonobacteraceae bacterium]|jgi:hypothetical protein|nr:DUF5348 domain-containing protein [Ktedonobacteraceae bacterium]
MQRAGQIQAQTDLASSEGQREVSHTRAQRVARPSFLLHGQVIHAGDQLAIRVLDTWVAGEVRQDRSGWYLLTAAQVGIRLSAGLTARREGMDQEQ